MATSYRTGTYEPQLKAGQEYQDYVARQLMRDGWVLVNFQSQRAQREWGENTLGLEIKFDQKLAVTGNFYIETAEKSDPRNSVYVPSGIYRDDGTVFYGIGNYREFFLFSKRTLKLEHLSRRFAEKETTTSRGFLIPRGDATELVERCFGPWIAEDDWGR